MMKRDAQLVVPTSTEERSSRPEGRVRRKPGLNLSIVMRPGVLFLVASAIAYSPVRAGGEDWSRFRGEAGSGLASVSNLPSSLSEGNLLWKSDLPFGRSSPIVTGSAVLLSASDENSFHLLSFDLDTGVEQWRHSLPRGRNTTVHEANDGASPTPTSDGETIYAYFPDFGVVAVSVEGEEIWKHPLPPFRSHYGLASSPVIAGDLLILLSDQQDQSYLLGLERDTGKQRWKVDRERDAAWTTPVVVESGKGPVVLTTSSLWVDGYLAETGEHLWAWLGVGLDSIASPIYRNGVLYVLQGGAYPMPTFDNLLSVDSNGDGKVDFEEGKRNKLLAPHLGAFDADGDGLVEREEWEHHLELAGTDTHGLMAVELPDPAQPPKGVLWRQKLGGSFIASPLVVGDTVFMVRTGGILSSHDRATGELVKRDRLPEAKGQYFASPVAGNDKLFVVSAAGMVLAITPEAEWEVLDSSNLDARIEATPALVDGKVVLRSSDSLLVYGKKNVQP